MKRFLSLLALALALTGCAAAPPPQTETPPLGETMTFTHGGLELEVSNVGQVTQDTLNDGGELFTYDVYHVYPGGTLTVLAADMWTPEGQDEPVADWAIYTATDQRIDLVDGMAPLEIAGDILGVYDPESSVYVLGFRMMEE